MPKELKTSGQYRKAIYELAEEITGKKLPEKRYKVLRKLLKDYANLKAEELTTSLNETLGRAFIENQKLRAGKIRVSHRGALSARSKLKKKGIKLNDKK